MATPDGMVTFEAAGATRSLRLTTNALCLLEDKTEKSALDLATELQFNPRIGTVRALFWAAGGDHGMTLAQVGELIDEIGLAQATDLAREAFSAAFPEPDPDPDGAGAAARPPSAVAG